MEIYNFPVFLLIVLTWTPQALCARCKECDTLKSMMFEDMFRLNQLQSRVEELEYWQQNRSKLLMYTV